jgi:DNA-directed RNA polymerase specialized sigma24 family protein
MDNHPATYSIDEIVTRCWKERNGYQSSGVATSPLCVELFRRAFAGDERAWQEVRQVFERQMRAWVGVQDQVEAEEVLQEGLLAFYRFAPNQPGLVATDDLAHVLSYLRECIKTALLMLLRKQRQPLDRLDSLADLQSSDNLGRLVEVRTLLRDRIKSLIQTADEQIVFQLYFIYQMRPQEIFTLYSRLFGDITAINTIVQRLTRRMRKDPTIQQLRDELIPARRKPDSSASLEIRDREHEGDRTAMDIPCDLDESVLLEYVLGRAPAEARAAIERSPACRRAADELAREVLPLLQVLYRDTCPSVATLVAHQQRQLSGVEQLVIRQHMLSCPACQSEYELLEAVDRVPLAPEPGPLRRLLVAMLAPEPQLVLRGAIRWYQTPDIAITLSTRRTSGHARSWTLRGQARMPDGTQAAGVVNGATLQSLDAADRAEIAGAVEPDGAFVFRNLAAGMYRLRLQTAEVEVVIPQIQVGDEPAGVLHDD